MKEWKLYAKGIGYKEWIIPSKQGLFVGGGNYASKVLAIRRRGSSKYFDVYVINRLCNTIELAEKVIRNNALRIAREYRKK